MIFRASPVWSDCPKTYFQLRESQNWTLVKGFRRETRFKNLHLLHKEGDGVQTGTKSQYQAEHGTGIRLTNTVVEIMKCGKLTAKLRDAVPVRFYENGREIKRFKNIEIPDSIKELEFQDFRFDVPESGPITFKIFFRPGTLPDTWPEARQRKTRGPKDADPMPMPEQPTQDAAKAAAEAISAAMDQAKEEGQPVDEITQAAAQGAEITTEIIDVADDGHEIIITAEDDPQDDPQPEAMTVHYDVPGSARKALANAIGEAIGAYPAYQAAPTFAYIIGEYTLDRQGILTGPHNAYLLGFLAQDGYQTK